MTGVLVWQPSLLDLDGASFDPSFPSMRRRFLGAGAWLNVAPGALTGAAALFEELVAAAPWGSHQRPMYDRLVLEPRLTTKQWDDPPPLVVDLGRALSDRYGLDLGVVSANLYRDGHDSVAW